MEPLGKAGVFLTGLGINACQMLKCEWGGSVSRFCVV